MWPVDACSDEVARHQVGRELDAVERAAQDLRRRLDRERLREPRNALDQKMSVCKQADQHPLQHRVLARDNSFDLEERAFKRLLPQLRLRARSRKLISHVVDSLSVAVCLQSEEANRPRLRGS